MVALSDKTKMIIGIAAFIVAVLLAAWGLYALFFKPTPPSPFPGTQPGTATGTDSGPLPVTDGSGTPITGGIQTTVPGATTPGQPASADVAAGGTTRLFSLIDAGARNPFPRADGQGFNFYDRVNRQFYGVDTRGAIFALSSQTFPDVQTVAWSPQGEKAIMEFPDGSNILYDFDAKKQVTLPANWTDFTFNPAGDFIAAKALNRDPDSRWLIISRPDGSETRGIAPLGNNAGLVTVAWSPDGRYFGFSDTGVNQGNGLKSLYLLSENISAGGTYDTVLVEGNDFRPLWAPDGSTILYSVYSPQTDWQPNLYAITDERTVKLNLNIRTWADKCTFADNATAYCAVPETLEDGAGLVPRSAEETPDYIVRINLTTGAREVVALPERSITVDSLFISPDGSALYLHDAVTQSIEKINLK